MLRLSGRVPSRSLLLWQRWWICRWRQPRHHRRGKGQLLQLRHRRREPRQRVCTGGFGAQLHEGAVCSTEADVGLHGDHRDELGKLR